MNGQVNPSSRPFYLGNGVNVGGGHRLIVAGPCAVESAEQFALAGDAVASAGLRVMRGGAWKPRTHPESFQGLGLAGLEIMARVCKERGLLFFTEAMQEEHVDAIVAAGGMVQIGARNMQNTSLLIAAGRAGVPVLLKRGLAARVGEWLAAAQYVQRAGCGRIIMCERGHRTYMSHVRFMLDLAAVRLVKAETGWPVIVDPSHAAGAVNLVPPLALAGIAAGADGLIVEIHPSPEHAICDAAQQIRLEDLPWLIAAAEKLWQAMDG